MALSDIETELTRASKALSDAVDLLANTKIHSISPETKARLLIEISRASADLAVTRDGVYRTA